MIEYKIVERESSDTLTAEVQKLLADGWHLAGHVFTVIDDFSVTYYQPMAKNPPPVKVITRYFMIEADTVRNFNELLDKHLEDGCEIHGIPLVVAKPDGGIRYSIMLEKPFNFDDQLDFCVRQSKDIDQTTNSDNIPE